MGRYLVRRLFLFILSLFILSQLSFCILFLLPGNQLDQEAGYTAVQLEQKQRLLLLREPLLSQLWHYDHNLLNLDFGNSANLNASVQEVLGRTFPITLKMGGASLIFALLAAFLLSRFSYLTVVRQVVYVGHRLIISTPTLVLGPVFIWFFVFYLDWFPRQPRDLFSWILPVIVLSLRPLFNLAKTQITSVEQFAKHPSSVVARAFGLSESRIWAKNMKGSWGPVFAQLPNVIAGLLSGALFVEMIFGVQGLGTLFVESLKNRDREILVALTCSFGAIYMSSQLVLDFIHRSIDVRLRSKDG